ncbi:hypothetical protein JDV09_11335 [Mycobacterium sp. Y57]|uniref:hypothetical protein n=1 Tax=Mycolicibacterium xanthum TaxID=2796469 RepID=UPI001C864134|nr:hypothetical protein [Mycolicibacterium xanthum]MBX7432692.1 hypothetical protein [Mycolicibacterium xanthum]
MPGLAEIAVASAPLAGGALLGMAAGNFKAPDMRAAISKDMDLLDRIPADQEHRRADLERVIDARIDMLINGFDKNQQIRAVAAGYEGNWRDIVVFLSAILFTVVWWNVEHSRADWLILFLTLLTLTAISGFYAVRGIMRGVKTYRESRQIQQHPHVQ